jgi:hypothetical protein
MPITSQQYEEWVRTRGSYEATFSEWSHQGVRQGPYSRQKDYVDDLLYLQVRGELTEAELAAFERVRAHDWITCSCDAWHKYCPCDYRNNLEGNWNGDRDFDEEREPDDGVVVTDTVANLYREL